MRVLLLLCSVFLSIKTVYAQDDLPAKSFAPKMDMVSSYIESRIFKNPYYTSGSIAETITNGNKEANRLSFSASSVVSSQLMVYGNPKEQEKITGGKRPPIGVIRIGGELLTGTALGFGLGYAGARLGSQSASRSGEFSGLGEGVTGGVIGLSIGSAAGVSIIGCLGDETGSFWLALAGSTVGAVIGARLSLQSDNIVYVIFSPIAAVIAFNASARYEVSIKNESALLNLTREGVSFGVLKPVAVMSSLESSRIIGVEVVRFIF